MPGEKKKQTRFKNTRRSAGVLREDALPYVNGDAGRKKFRFIDLFCGIGGFRLAFERAGGSCVFSSDWDKYSQITYEANFGENPRQPPPDVWARRSLALPGNRSIDTLLSRAMLTLTPRALAHLWQRTIDAKCQNQFALSQHIAPQDKSLEFLVVVQF